MVVGHNLHPSCHRSQSLLRAVQTAFLPNQIQSDQPTGVIYSINTQVTITKSSVKGPQPNWQQAQALLSVQLQAQQPPPANQHLPRPVADWDAVAAGIRLKGLKGFCLLLAGLRRLLWL